MKLRLAVLSVLAGWALLADLAIGLLLILRPLERIRGSLQQIAMGVRAIEQETGPLGNRVDTLAGALGQAGAGVGAVARRLADVDRNLDAAAPSLRQQG